MQIKEDHFYHGAALNQIAEHKYFTAINALKVNSKVSRSAFKVNDDIAVYLKYARKPTGTYHEYIFTFNKAHLKELVDINNVVHDLHLALVCVKDREICCIPYTLFTNLIGSRRDDAGHNEDQYTLLVTIKQKEKFRVYLNAPGRRKTMLGDPNLVARNRFPSALFR